jgi:hypothetical protein
MKRLIWLLMLTLVACGPAGVVTPTFIPMPSFATSTRIPSPTSLPLSTRLEYFIGNSSCSWPCWQGITPGVTKSSDALQLLQASPVVSKSTVQSKEFSPGIGTARWYWEIGNNQYDGYMEWQDGIISRIDLTAYPKFSIGEMVSRFGTPEKVEVIDCSPIVEAPQHWCAVFYYTRMGFGIDARWEMAEDATDILFTPNDSVRSVSLFEPSTIEEFFFTQRSGSTGL